LILAAVWWAWVAYAWLTNTVNADRIPARLALLAAMGAMLVVSLSVPEAFDEAALLFISALVVLRLMHVVLFVLGAKTPEMRVAAIKLGMGVATAGSLLVFAAFLHDTWQVVVWGVALVIDYSAPLIAGTKGWHVSPAHFAERHGLIVIIALGEAIISLGVGATGLPITVGLVAAAACGLVCAFCLWWLYFDQSIVFAEKKLSSLHGEARNRLARDSYSYLHLPIVTGIVLFALGAKKTLAHLGDHLHDLPAIGIGLGPALVPLTLSILRKRHTGRYNRLRLLAAALCVATIPLGMYVSAIAALFGVTAILAGLVAIEAIVWALRGRRTPPLNQS
jgi:low temperature requirement protein LtrA